MKILLCPFVKLPFALPELSHSDYDPIHQEYSNLALSFHLVTMINSVYFLLTKLILDEAFGQLSAFELKLANESEYWHPILGLDGVGDQSPIAVIPHILYHLFVYFNLLHCVQIGRLLRCVERLYN